MTEPLRFPLSPFQQARFAALTQQEQQAIAPIVSARNEAATAIIGATTDPASVAGWHIAIEATEIVCTPPAEM